MRSYSTTVCVIMLLIAMCAVHCWDESWHLPSLKESMLIKAAYGYKDLKRLPVFLYHQAGDYLPENRQIRGKFDHATIASSPYLACRITMEPIKYFKLDAAIMFWDNAVVPSKLFGMKLSSNRSKGFRFEEPLKPDAIGKYMNRNVSFAGFEYLKDEIIMLRHKLQGRMPLLATLIGPWTLFCYMCEGHEKALHFLRNHKNDAKKVMEKLTNILVQLHDYFKNNGVQVFQWTETHTEYLSSEEFHNFYMTYPRNWLATVRAIWESGYAYIFYNKGCTQCLLEIGKSKFDVVAVDETIDPKWLRRLFAPLSRTVCVQGNFDPLLLLNPPDKIRELVKEMVQKYGKNQYVVNLGSNIWPKNVSIESVSAFVNAAHEI